MCLCWIREQTTTGNILTLRSPVSDGLQAGETRASDSDTAKGGLQVTKSQPNGSYRQHK